MNAFSVRNKTCLIRDLITDSKIDILCLTETWLNDSDTAVIEELIPETHKFVHQPRDGKGGGVGVAIAKFITITKIVRGSFLHFECLEVHLKNENNSIALFVIYRPPGYAGQEFIEEFESFLLHNETSNDTNLYVGDFNIWFEDCANVQRNNFKEVLDNFHIRNYTMHPTFASGHILDLVITNSSSRLVSDLTVEPVSTISDHRIISFKLKLGVHKEISKKIKFRKVSNIDYKEFNSVICNVQKRNDSETCAHNQTALKCTECCIQQYKQETRNFFEASAPLITKVLKIRDENSVWYNSEIRRAKRNMRKAEKKYRRLKTLESRDEYRTLRQLKCNTVKRVKTEFYSSKIKDCGNDQRKLQMQLKKLLGKKNDFEDLPRTNNDKLLADQFKDFFIQKIQIINETFAAADQTHEMPLPDFPLREFNCFRKVSRNEIIDIVGDINKCGYIDDPFDMKLINFDNIKENFAHCLSSIVESSFDEGVFPNSEKFSIVRPKLKHGKDVNDLNSYRPLYNVSFLSKVLETAALRQLMTHLSGFDFLSPHQSAYRKGHSVETALCKIYNDLLLNKCKGNSSLLIQLDLSAAFDTVDTSLLLRDLEQIGISGKVLSWFTSYLKERKFEVLIGESRSDMGTMVTGVPQGSILGPILFVIYTASLQHLLSSLDVSFHFYADDTQIYFTVNGTQEAQTKMINVYESVSRWMRTRKLKLNPGKTEILLVAPNQRRDDFNQLDNIVLGGSEVRITDEVRSLGFIIDGGLSLRTQLKDVKRRVFGSIVNISRISKYIDLNSRLTLVHNLIFSSIDFCNSLYCNLPNHALRTLQLLINSAARIVKGVNHYSRERVTPMCIDLHFLPVKARIQYKICLLAHKAIHTGDPRYLADLLSYREISTTRPARASRRDLVEPMLSRLVSVNRAFAYSAPRMYNSLPDDVKEARSIDTFKRKLKTFLFTEAYNLDSLELNATYIV